MLSILYMYTYNVLKQFFDIVKYSFFSFFISRNPGVRTIEEELLNALFKAEVITEDDKACLGKVQL